VHSSILTATSLASAPPLAARQYSRHGIRYSGEHGANPRRSNHRVWQNPARLGITTQDLKHAVARDAKLSAPQSGAVTTKVDSGAPAAHVGLKPGDVGITVTIPILPVLRAGPCGDLAFICGDRGQPLTKESFGNLFRDACNAAGIAKSAHGVRKIGATRAATNGATVAELDAIFGWQGGGMASLYTRGRSSALGQGRYGETTGE
jgi:hypothetical protein